MLLVYEIIGLILVELLDRPAYNNDRMEYNEKLFKHNEYFNEISK